jgi:hypothetical protein
VKVFNLYLPPTLRRGDASKARLWLDHVRRIYPDDASHLIAWLAHRVQRPGEKINHAIVLGGPQGIGKDSALEPAKRAVGPWNCDEVSPTQVMGRFNGYLKSVILRISEARDLGEVNRYAFASKMKTIIVAPPDVLRIDEKNLKEYYIPNVCAVIITTNERDALYLSPDDRRHYVAWSECQKEEFPKHYWQKLWAWYDTGGAGHVAAYLAQYDLTGFDAKAPPPQTAAWHSMVDAGLTTEADELAAILGDLGNPKAVTVEDLVTKAPVGFQMWLRDGKNAVILRHRLEEVGYVTVHNPGDKKRGRWTISGKQRKVYVQRELSPKARIAAAQERVGRQL